MSPICLVPPAGWRRPGCPCSIRGWRKVRRGCRTLGRRNGICLSCGSDPDPWICIVSALVSWNKGLLACGPSPDSSNTFDHILLRQLFFFFCFLIEVELIYNVVLISAVQQSDSVIHIYTLFFIFFSIMVYPRRLDRVPCALQ